jgi:hypothetical protein
MKYFPRKTDVNHEQTAAINAALINELEHDKKPTSMIIAKLKNLIAIRCMSSLGLNSNKSMQFFNGDYKHVEFLRLLHAVTMIDYEVKITFQPSDFQFGTIKIDAC